MTKVKQSTSSLHLVKDSLLSAAGDFFKGIWWILSVVFYFLLIALPASFLSILVVGPLFLANHTTDSQWYLGYFGTVPLLILSALFIARICQNFDEEYVSISVVLTCIVALVISAAALVYISASWMRWLALIALIVALFVLPFFTSPACCSKECDNNE